MRKFRSQTIIHKLTQRAFVFLALICMLGVFQLAFSHFAFAIDTNSSTPSSEINVDLVNGIAVRILDASAQQEINNVNLDLTAVPGGSFTSGKFNVEVSTSNKTGYKLYMESSYDQSSITGSATPSYTTNLVNQVNTSYAIPTLTNNVSLAEFQAGSNNSSNKWGYSLDDASFSPIPAHNAPAEVDSSSTPTASGLTPVTIGTNVNMDMASGVYKNQLTFSAVAEPVPSDYSLYFQPGTTDTVTNLPETMTYSGVATSHTFTVPATAPSRTGYNFTGYLDESTSTTYQAGDSITIVGDIDYTGSATLTAQWEKLDCISGTNPNHVCFYSNEPSGTVSGTMEDQTIVYMTSETAEDSVDRTPLSGSTTELTLYSPNWTLSGYGFKGWNTKADGSGTMYGPNQTITLTADQQTQLGTSGLPIYAQWVASAGDMASWSGCSSLTQGSVTALTYEGDTYAVAKLADDKCWMIENYRLDSPIAGTKTTSMSTSSYNSREYNVTNVSGTAGAYPINLTSPAAASSTSNQYSWKSYGGYYSWASAINTTTAGSGRYSNWNGSSFSYAITATAQGICPAGWRLPRSYARGDTDNTESDFRYLNSLINNGSWGGVETAEGSNNWRKFPNNFVFAGDWNNFSDASSSYGRGTYGHYWSSTVYDSSIAYALYFDSISVYSSYTINYKYGGLSVRCMIGS